MERLSSNPNIGHRYGYFSHLLDVNWFDQAKNKKRPGIANGTCPIGCPRPLEVRYKVYLGNFNYFIRNLKVGPTT